MEHAKPDEERLSALTAIRLGKSGRRWSVLIVLVVVLALFAMVPALLRLGPSGTEL